MPTITPKTAKQTPPLPKDHGEDCITEDNRPQALNDADDDDETRELNNTEDVHRAHMANLILENNKLKSENEKLSLEKTAGYELCLERVKDDDKMFRFYTGICYYTTFEALYKYLVPAVHNLAYKDSQTYSGNILTTEYVK